MYLYILCIYLNYSEIIKVMLLNVFSYFPMHNHKTMSSLF